MKTMNKLINTLEPLTTRSLESCFLRIIGKVVEKKKMNMIIHDDGHTNVIGADALVHISHLTARNKSFGENKFDVILTNPPFGSMVKQEEKPYLRVNLKTVTV